MTKQKQHNKTQWKAVQIDDENLNSQGLIAFEECTDYNFIQPERDIKTRIKRKKSTKPDPSKSKKPKLSQETKNVILTPSKTGSSTETDVQIQDKVDENDYKTWSNYGVPEPLIKALSLQGFRQPTPIQSLTLPAAILGRRDIVGAAETGSGKTLAFGLPILAGILRTKSNDFQSDKKPLYALILTPTRELAMQVRDHLVAAAKFTDIKVAVVIGGMAAVKQERVLNMGPEIVVATPGRLWELIQEGNAHLSQIEDIRYLAIDETDRMLERGHFEELHSLLERLNFDQTKSQKRQNFVFSATLTLVHDVPKYLINKSKKIAKMTPQQKLKKIVDILGVTNPKTVDITHEMAVPGTLTESRLSCAFAEKDYYVYYFLQKHPGRTLIFCNSIGCVKRLSNLLGILGCRPLPLHASMPQRQRLKNLERFRDQENSVLVATDVAARGLDIPKIQHVLHYQIPRTSETYIHRSGRTARASEDGLTLLLIEPSEVHSYIKLCRTLDKNEDIPTFPIQEAYLRAVKERVNLARDLDKMDLDIRKTSSEENWLQKAAKDMDIIVDDFSRKHDNSDISSKKKLADSKRKQLSFLLAKPIFPIGFTGKYPLNLGNDFLEDRGSAVELVKNTVKTTTKRKNRPLFKSKNKKEKKSK